jgi:hypothetical protein
MEVSLPALIALMSITFLFTVLTLVPLFSKVQATRIKFLISRSQTSLAQSVLPLQARNTFISGMPLLVETRRRDFSTTTSRPRSPVLHGTTAAKHTLVAQTLVFMFLTRKRDLAQT